MRFFALEFFLFVWWLHARQIIAKYRGLVLLLHFFGKITRAVTRTLMDLSPLRQNFEKNRNRKKYHHSLKEHPTFTKIAKLGCEML